MADITSTATGNWSAGATWVGGTAPGNGDNAICLHDITVDVNTTIGTSPAATAVTAHDVNTAAIAVTGATLTIAEDIQLTVRGNLTLSNSKIIQELGSTYEFDASQATTPLSQNYYALISIDWANANTWWECQGTVAKPCSIQSNASGGNGYTDTYSIPIGARATYGGMFRNSTFVNFTRIGDASIPAIRPQFSNTSGIDLDLTDSIFDACGKIQCNSLAALSDFIFDRNTFTNSVATELLYLVAGSVKDAGATRSIQDCVFDDLVTIHTANGFTFDGTLFYDQFTGTNNSAPASFENCLVRNSTRSPLTTYGSPTDCLFLKDGTLSNPHWQTPSTAYDSTFDGCVFEHIGTKTGDTGDCIVGPSSGTVTVTIKNNIFTRDDSCPLSLLGASSGQAYVYEHNTGAYQVNVNETVTSYAGMITSFKSNIGFGASAGSHYMIHDTGGGAVSDIVAGANLDYNCDFNLIAGSEGNGINIPITAAHSANSITADPTFVDSTRDIESWDLSLGGAGTVANALTELMKRNTPTYNSAYSIAALVTYYKGGYAPANSSLENAGHDGVTIGAVEYAAPSVGGGSNSRFISGMGQLGLR